MIVVPFHTLKFGKASAGGVLKLAVKNCHSCLVIYIIKINSFGFGKSKIF